MAKKKSPAKKNSVQLSDRERGAIGVLLDRGPALGPPRYREDKAGTASPDEPTGDNSVFSARLAVATGTNSIELATRMIQQAGQVAAAPTDDPVNLSNATAAAIAGIRPRDELEGLLASQMVGCHGIAMEMMRRSNSSKYVEQLKVHGMLATKFLRLFIDQVDALSRLRGKAGKQTVRVEHVHVEAGGQAVVGAITPGRGHGEER